MKKSVILSAILFGSLVYNTAEAQISIHLGFNVPVRRVVYAPAPQPVQTVYDDNFDDSDDYYYLPEVEAYYSLSRQCYFYNDGARWISAAYLPGSYRNYDWRTARHFEIRGRRPYMNHDVYRGRWGGNDNRGDWNRGNNNYAGRGYDNRNYGGGGFNRGGFGGNQPRDNGYNQPQPNRNDDRGGRGGWDHQSQGNDNRGRGNWGGGQAQPQQPSRGDNQGRGNWGGGQAQPQQPSQNNGGGQGRGNWGGGQQQPQQPGQQAQPSNNGGGRDRGNNGGGQGRGNGDGQFAQNQNGGRMGMARPRF
ncbi:hypothetical protein [Mucilaginibacter glaciei]|uniref:DUF3300 domain-containing protein n=1 Tax=Mucilaginibacter glaciei TaxID=2772109 RepID=A0A926S2Z6_9SPHI|nr:hypothetical protein [Mucilaginibacter glaciei]MBD1394688.1 hypothetical protein [Mucilaginibacter glaciei]